VSSGSAITRRRELSQNLATKTWPKFGHKTGRLPISGSRFRTVYLRFLSLRGLDLNQRPLGYESGGLVPSVPSGVVPYRPVRARCRQGPPRAAEVRVVRLQMVLHQGKQHAPLPRPNASSGIILARLVGSGPLGPIQARSSGSTFRPNRILAPTRAGVAQRSDTSSDARGSPHGQGFRPLLGPGGLRIRRLGVRVPPGVLRKSLHCRGLRRAGLSTF
jgi:hypothetical protein